MSFSMNILIGGIQLEVLSSEFDVDAASDADVPEAAVLDCVVGSPPTE